MFFENKKTVKSGCTICIPSLNMYPSDTINTFCIMRLKRNFGISAQAQINKDEFT
jgi:hypothetical protein